MILNIVIEKSPHPNGDSFQLLLRNVFERIFATDLLCSICVRLLFLRSNAIACRLFLLQFELQPLVQ